MFRFPLEAVQLIVVMKPNHFSEYINLVLTISTVAGVLFAILSPRCDSKKRKISIKSIIVRELELNEKIAKLAKEAKHHESIIAILRNLQASSWITFSEQIGTLFDGNVLEKLHPYYSRLLTFIEEIRLQSNLQNNFVTESLKSNNRTYKIPEYFPPIMNGFIDNTPKIIDIIKKGNKSKYYSDPSLLEFLTLEPNASDYGIKLNEAIPEPVLESHKY